MHLVTGGAGFIGSHLVTGLVERGEPVRVFDNLSGGTRENLRAVGDGIDLIEGDLRDETAVRRAVKNVDVVFHLAALGSVPRSIADPRTTFDVNVTGTLNLLLAARDAGCRRIIFASSSSVYGNTPVMPKTETMAPSPLSPYAISKLTGEQLCSVFTNLYGLETVSLRYFNVFGPRQNPTSQYAAVIPKFLQALQMGDQPVIYGDGGQSRDFTYVDNVVDANVKAAAAGGIAGRIFNIASGRSISVNAMLALMARLMGKDVRARHDPPRPGDVRHSLADTTAAQEALGYELGVSFEEGLERTVEAAMLVAVG